MREPKFMDYKFLKYLSDTTMFCPDMKIPIKTNPYVTKYKIENWKIKGKKQKRIKCPIVFLVDASIISYGETVLSIIDNYDLGLIIGSPTAGVTGDIAIFSDHVFNYCIWTGMRVDKNNGDILFNKGIIPDIYIRNSLYNNLNNKDVVVEEAINEIRKINEK